jgi:hypothetical protein
VFSEIEQISHKVTDGGNPILMNLNQRYVVKGIGTEKKISSVVEIKTNEDGSKIVKLLDKWNGEIPSGAIRDVSLTLGKRGQNRLIILGFPSTECCNSSPSSQRAEGVAIVGMFAETNGKLKSLLSIEHVFCLAG